MSIDLRIAGPGESYVRVIADSINSTTGDRVTSFEVNAHRFILAEINTHCLFARNSASSRAIPVDRQLLRYADEPALPVRWPAEQKGMQGGEDLSGEDLADAQRLFEDVRGSTYAIVHAYLKRHPDKATRLHKSLINRFLEPMQWHKMLITAASYENFFDQRVSPNAQPELQVVAALMKELYAKSDPAPLVRGQWHLPYMDLPYTGVLSSTDLLSDEYDPRKISAARCARTSYMTQEGKRDFSEDERLYNDLVTNGHWSPLEHVCTPWTGNAAWVPILDPDGPAGQHFLGDRRVPRLGKFTGWQQFRHLIEGRLGYVSHR